MSSTPITSRANPLIKELAQLAKARNRRAKGRFLIEGGREIERAIAGGIDLERILVAPELLARQGRELPGAVPDGVETVEVSASAFGALSRRQNPDGLIAVGKSPARHLASLDLSVNPFVLVAERIEKPGNLGGIFRTCDGAGVDAVLVADAATDLENPNVVRASQGSVFTVPAAVAPAAECVDYLRRHRLAFVALTPDASDELWDLDLTGPVAIAVGSEDAGLSDTIVASARTARLPMSGRADSLNASVAAAVALYEVVRQRR
jgi:TrmH family RNA methyltransferase